MPNYRYTYYQVEDLCAKEFGWRGEVTQTGEFVCHCPVHDDKNASLHVRLKDDGSGILMKCMSHGCDVYGYMSRNRLWPQQLDSQDKTDELNRKYERQFPERTVPRFKWNSLTVTHNEAVRRIKQLKPFITLKTKGGKPFQYTLTSTHLYTDGKLAQSFVARYDHPEKGKRFLQYTYGYYDSHDDPNKPTDPEHPRWQIKGWNTDNAKAMLYALTYLENYDKKIVVVVEGEKAADFGNTTPGMPPNVVFTTWKGGAQSVERTDWSPLEGRNVILWPDHDEAGRIAMDKVAEALDGVAAKVKHIDTSGLELPKGFDIADYADESMFQYYPSLTHLLSSAKELPEIEGEGSDKLPKEEEEDPYDDAPFPEPDVQDPYDYSRVFYFDPSKKHLEEAHEFMDSIFVEIDGGKSPLWARHGLLRPRQKITPRNTEAITNDSARIKVQLKEDGKPVPYFKLWRERKHNTVQRLGFHPKKEKIYVDERGDKVLNTWPGFPVESQDKSGSCDLFLKHIRFVCSAEEPEIAEELYQFIIVWLARMVQCPENKQGVIPVFRGKQGTGKSIIATYLGKMMGPDLFISLSNLEQVFGNFTSQVCYKILVNIEELSLKKGAYYDRLKDMATNPMMINNEKGLPAFQVENFTHIIGTTNRELGAPVVDDERRILPIEVPDKYMQDPDYFGPLADEMNSGGPAALFQYLREIEIPKAYLPLPKTNALREHKRATRELSREHRDQTTVLEWYSTCLKHGAIVSGSRGPSAIAWSKDKNIEYPELYLHFKHWLEDRSRAHISAHMFSRIMQRFYSGKINSTKTGFIENPVTGRFSIKRVRGKAVATMPSLVDARKVFMEEMGDDCDYYSFGSIDEEETDDNGNVIDFKAPF